jgi:hypothetical protein
MQEFSLKAAGRNETAFVLTEVVIYKYNGGWINGYFIGTVAIRGNYIFRRYDLLSQNCGQYSALREKVAQNCVFRPFIVF